MLISPGGREKRRLKIPLSICSATKATSIPKIVDNDIRYKTDSFVFNVAGAGRGQAVQRDLAWITWGRWSNAQLGSEVKIEYKELLPENSIW